MFASMDVFLLNDSGRVSLRRGNFNATGGEWAPNGNNGQLVPPERVAPGERIHFATSSDGVGTGTSGFVDYIVELPGEGDIGSVSFNWSVPFIGENSLGHTQRNAADKYLLEAWVENEHPDGDHATGNVRVRVSTNPYIRI